MQFLKLLQRMCSLPYRCVRDLLTLWLTSNRCCHTWWQERRQRQLSTTPPSGVALGARVIHVWHDSRMCVTWHVWHDSCICVTWLIHMCDVIHSYEWHDCFITGLIHMCDRTHSYVWRDTFIGVTWRIYFTYLQHCPAAWHSAQVTWRIDTCHMPHLYVWHESFICHIDESYYVLYSYGVLYNFKIARIVLSAWSKYYRMLCHYVEETEAALLRLRPAAWRSARCIMSCFHNLLYSDNVVFMALSILHECCIHGTRYSAWILYSWHSALGTLHNLLYSILCSCRILCNIIYFIGR